jgi:transposase
MNISQEFSHKAREVDFQKLIKGEKNNAMRIRLLALQNLKEGKTITSICSHLKVCRDTVRIWARKFLKEGKTGLWDRAGRGRKSKLTFLEMVLISNYTNFIN